MTTRVYLVRHGETDWNATGRWQGHAPVPLNAAGLAQSAALGRYLASNGARVQALYSSDLARAMQTAEAIAAALALPVVPDVRLREIDLGEWQGLTRDEAADWDAARYAAYRDDWRRVPAPGGESRGAIGTRARAAFDEIVAQHPDQSVLVVTHGGTLGMLLENLFGPMERPSLSNTSLTVVERAAPDGPWVLVRVAWTPHLAPDQALGETW